MIRTRFAPSPTGFLHIGGLRTALYSFLIAKQNNGKFILRVEDTDQKRTVTGGIENIIRSLNWAGIAPDEGPYLQSERLEIYQKYAKELVDKGNAYYCFCASERLEELRQKQQARKQPTGYDGHCLKLSAEEVKGRLAAGEKHVIRLKMPKEGETVFNDLIRGEVSFKNELVDDQVIIKADGFPTYHLAVVVDDHLMKITHIIRGEEWLSSTPKHIQLYKYFGWEIPKMAHLPLLLNPDKSKLSKRQGDVAVEDYRRQGYLPEALVNFVAFLGWNPGTEQEIFSLEELVKEFKIEKVGKSGAVFNLEKLNWYNQQYLRRLSDNELIDKAKPFLEQKEAVKKAISDKRYDKKQMVRILNLEKERITTLAELPEAVKFAFVLPDYQPGMLVWKKSSLEELKKVLPELKDCLNKFSVQAWKKEKLEWGIGEWIKAKGYSNGGALWPLRVALSGQEKSPGPFEIMEALGKEEVLNRLKIALAKIS